MEQAAPSKLEEATAGRKLRLLIASADADRILLVRQALMSWPGETVCRVAASWEDAVTQFDGHAPDVLFWDRALSIDPPAATLAVPVLLLEPDTCLPLDPAQQNEVLRALTDAVQKEFRLRAGELQLRSVQGAEVRMRALLSRARDGVVVVDRHGHVLFANPAAHVLCGVGDNGWEGERFDYPIPPPEQPVEVVVKGQDQIRRRVTFTAALTVWHLDEAVALLLQEVGASTLPFVGSRGVAHEERLRAIGRLAAGVAHEVNNPLTFVLANLESLRESQHHTRGLVRKLRELMQDGAGPEELLTLLDQESIETTMEDVTEMLTDCSKGINRIQDIVRSLGTFARVDDDEPEWVDVTQVVDDACAMVFNQIRYRARLVKRFEPVPFIAAYPGRIAQALVNLLVNAAESIQSGTYDEHRIVVSTALRDDNVVIGVSDTGVGVPEEQRDQIFVAGFTTKAHEGGMGLGLALCVRVAEEHQGTIRAAQNRKQGTLFELVLPIKSDLQPRLRARDSRPISDAPKVAKQRLLVVDDDAMVLAALRRRLRRHYEVVTMLGGREALAALESDADFAAVICDLMMPEVDGKAFYDALTTALPELAQRVVFISGGAFTSRLRKFAAEVPNPVLPKPVSKRQLDQVLQSITGPTIPPEA